MTTYVIFDLEAVLVSNAASLQHIVEIGAVKVEKKDGILKIGDSFHVYIRPSSRRLLNNRTMRFIGADIDSFKRAPSIQKAFKMFKDWIVEEDCYLCAWSNGELWMLAENRAESKFDLSWMKNFIDIQPMVSLKLTEGNEGEIALKRAVKLTYPDLEDGSYHSAILDSFSTANLFIEHYDSIEPSLTPNLDPFSIVSRPLYRLCRMCGEIKRYSDFRMIKKRHAGRCVECRIKILKQRAEEEELIKRTEADILHN